MNSNSNIDELLTGFIDGELPDRQQAEVQRMISNDPQVARRLRQLQNCKTLISSLPPAESPGHILEQIRHSLKRRTLLAQEPAIFASARGARHLFMRKLATAAVMIGLLAGLTTVVYEILAPVPTTGPRQLPLARDYEPPGTITPIQPAPRPQAAGEFWGRLELKTNALAAVSASINRAIEDNSLADCLETTILPDRTLYSLNCSKESLAPLLADLAGIWHRFSSTALLVETKQFGRPVVVDSITAQQTAQIVGYAGLPKCTEIAKNFAVLNSVTELAPAKTMLAHAGRAADSDTDLTVVPKPVLTGGTKSVSKASTAGEQEPKINLTIVLLGRE